MAEVRAATDLLRELDVTLSRQDKVTAPAVCGRSRETPLPFHVGATEATRELRAAIRAMAATTEVHPAQVDRFRDARARATAIVDTPDPRVFVGLCTCETALYARSADTEVVCRSCRARWSATPPSAWDELRKMSGTATQLRKWLVTLGHPRSRTQLYRDLGQITPVRTGEYRLADLLDHVARVKAHRRGA